MKGEPAAPLAVTKAQFRFSVALTQILVYVVVLNLFVEYLHTVVIDSFTVSVLTAVLLWLMLRAILAAEHRIADFFRQKEGVLFRILRYLSVWAILFLSKFVILEVVGFVFRGRAALGHFLEVVAITVALMVVEVLLRCVYRWLGGAKADRPSKMASAN